MLNADMLFLCSYLVVFGLEFVFFASLLILDFGSHLPTFRALNKPKSRSSKTENNAQTLPKQPQSNFEKVPKTIFSIPKIVKDDPLKCQKFIF